MIKKTIISFVTILTLSSCSYIDHFNTVEGKLLYEEHYATFNNIDYESGEKESYGGSITSKKIYDDEYGFDYSFFPDVSFETSTIQTRSITERARYKDIKINRLSAFLGARGTFYSMFGILDLNLEVGPSYTQASNSDFKTSKVEPAFRYEGVYTLFLFEGLYAAVSSLSKNKAINLFRILFFNV